MGNEIKIIHDGATITIAPISLALADQLLVGLEVSKACATFGIECNPVRIAPGNELGCLSLSFDNTLSVSLDSFYKLLGITPPVDITGSQNIGICKYLLVLVILGCIPEPQNAYSLDLHVGSPSIPDFGKPRITPEEGSAPTEVRGNE